MSRLALYLLGPPRLERDGEPLQFDTRKIIALVAYLAVAGPGLGGQPHTRESLITLLWPELEPSRARAVLRRNLSLLRKALDGEWLVVDREIVDLDPETDVWIDVAQFRSLLQVCKGHDHPEADVCSDCLAALTEAVELYQGDFLAGFTLRDSVNFDEFQFFQTEELRRELASALERLVRGRSAQGAYEAAISYARRWLALDPLHEPAHRCLMELYAQAGQRSAALRQYEECVRILEEELGLLPAEETTSLYERIRTGIVEGERPLTTAVRPRHNLPTQVTPFIGREDELAAIKARLKDPDCRLLTLVGPGGSGKTRLALEAAAAQLDNFEHGVFFISLAPLQSVDGIVPTVAQAVGFSLYGGSEPEQQLLDYLRKKHMLIIMDNYEHLLPPSVPPGGGERGGGKLVTDVLKMAPGVKILATSRARLNVGGEHRFQIGGMDVPDREAWEDVLAQRPQKAARKMLQSHHRPASHWKCSFAQPGWA